MTHYEVLGVAHNAPAADIRRAYVRLARQHHPDYYAAADAAVRLGAERRMRTINEAWSVLGDEGRRRDYDRAEGLAGQGTTAGEDLGFRPFDTGDDDIDPLDLPDEPYRADHRPASLLGRLATLAPVLAFLASIVFLAVGMVVNSVTVLALSVAALLMACLGFVILPLVALSRASRND
ncbi:MAG: J domain-containing protein [Acidimicrobiales bacterium]